MVPQAGVEPASKFLLLRETTLPICLLGLVGHNGIEPLCLGCRPSALPLS